MPGLSVVLPTFNEAANIGGLLEELRRTLGGAAELLVVDDDSPDGTADVARKAGARVIVRQERGLATAVMRGVQEARGDFVVVMDADGQHPVDAVRRMHAKAIASGAQLVVGSRYVEGGSDGAFGPVRRVVSAGAKLLSHASLPQVRRHRLTDPMSGLFLVRRDKVDLEALRPKGYKILLEILARIPFERVKEVGYTFQDRRGGRSKLGPTVIVQYLFHVLALGLQQPENQRILRFGTVGASGVVVNLGLLVLLTEVAGLYYLLSAAISVETSIITNFLLNDAWTFRSRRRGHRLMRLAKFNSVALVALALNLATLAFLTEVVGLYYVVSAALAILVSFAANYAGNLRWTYRGDGPGDASGGGPGDGRVEVNAAPDTGSPPRRAAPPLHGAPSPPSGPGRLLLAWVPFFLVVTAASGMLLYDLDRPDEIYFDEHYYVTVAYQATSGEWEDPCWVNDDLDHRPLNFEHPPLAKLIITASVALLDPDPPEFTVCREPDSDGYEEFTTDLRHGGSQIAWRLPSALFGIATVVFAGLATARLTGMPGSAAVGSLLAASDGVLITSARMAILDIFVTAFVVAALYAATFPTRRGIIAASLLLALGFACKFSALFAGPGVLLVLLWSHWRAGRLTLRRAGASAAATTLTPIPVLLLSYLPWWALWIPTFGVVGAVRHWYHIMHAALGWGFSVQSGHAYASSPIEWPLLSRPVFYYRMSNVGGVEGLDRYIYGIPNPVLWWATGLAAVWLLVVAGRGIRDEGGLLAWFRTLTGPAQAAYIAMAVAVSVYGGFLTLTRETFLFYTTLLAPLLAIALAVTLADLWRRHLPWGRITGAIVVVLAVAALIFYWPVLTARTITADHFEAIMGLIPWMRT